MSKLCRKRLVNDHDYDFPSLEMHMLEICG